MSGAAKQHNPDLTKEQKEVLFNKGTEAPFTGRFLENKETGMYVCANCGHQLFASGSQYHSDAPGLAGWPSFNDVAHTGAITLQEDNSHGMKRIEVMCANCGAHLGHVFDESESKTGKHFCINDCALDFKASKKPAKPSGT